MINYWKKNHQNLDDFHLQVASKVFSVPAVLKILNFIHDALEKKGM